MENLTWYYPATMQEAARLLKEPGIIPHGGGTGILRTGTERLRGLIDLRRLPLFHFEAQDGTMDIGAGLTYCDVIRHVKAADSGNILVQSLSKAAATPLRNRITIGGSVAMAPVWSDLLGPLLALEADVVLAGASDGPFAIAEYIRSRDLREGTLIKSIRIRTGGWRSRYFRAAATHFDYAGFSITALARVDDQQTIEDLRLVVVGNKQKFMRLSSLEDSLVGRNVEDLDFENIAADIDIEFSTKTIGSPHYVRRLFNVELERILEAVLTG